ncbi:hypothetical protein K1719_044157 [Acacia pycnantha]|nr:hypothetical protein K1719_044157 [Acacia pycnantha]
MRVGDVGGRIWAGKKEEREEAKEEVIQSLKQLEETLGVKNFFGDESFGCFQRPSVSKSLASKKKIHDFVVDFRNKNQLD